MKNFLDGLEKARRMFAFGFLRDEIFEYYHGTGILSKKRQDAFRAEGKK